MMRIKILTLILLFVGLNVFFTAPALAENSSEIPIGSTTAPSSSFLQSEKASAASSDESGMVAYGGKLGPRSNYWNRYATPGEEETDVVVVGGSVGDATLPIILSMLLIFITFSFLRGRKKQLAGQLQKK